MTEVQVHVQALVVGGPGRVERGRGGPLQRGGRRVRWRRNARAMVRPAGAFGECDGRPVCPCRWAHGPRGRPRSAHLRHVRDGLCGARECVVGCMVGLRSEEMDADRCLHPR
ncbi:hypothetical protein QJS66_07475 [Kocuria rhizophila]|nr:hypothetical protein QJS66_07475 [Kocuria rhizophila]